MRPAVVAAILAAALVACSSSKASDPVGDSSRVVTAGTVTVSAVNAPVAVSSVADPVAVSRVAEPVMVSSVAAPVAVSAVAAPVAVSSVQQPVAISTIASPVVVTGAVAIPRPENDPERIEGGTLDTASTAGCGSSPFCRALADGPLILTDVVATARAGSSPSIDLLVCSTATGFCYGPRWRLTLTVPSATSYTTGSIASGSVYTTTTSDGVGVRTLTGARFAVRAGETLFAYTSGVFDLTWSGFRP